MSTVDLANSANIVEDRGERNTRRAFLTAAGAAGLCYTAALAYPIYRYLASPEEMALSATAVTEVTLKDAQKLPAGSVLMFKFGTRPAMLIHHTDGRWISMTAVCTHLGCTVQYEPQADRVHCACHGGVYNPYTGANVSGPPPKPLTLYKVAVNDAGVTVSRA
jgi:cytochrome b6-f complex iron-sulfur subunit